MKKAGKELKIHVLALGGSAMCPAGPDADFLKRFRAFILPLAANGHRFAIVAGGGSVARDFQKAAGMVAKVDDEDKDWLGIHSSRLNAHLLRTIFRDIADPVIWDSEDKVKEFGKYKIVIGAGWTPGWSTDYVAVKIAIMTKSERAVILGKPDRVYDKDNAIFPDAKPLERMSWREYRKLVPAKWSPGIHAPVDPVAVRAAEKAGLPVIVASASDLKNTKDIILGREFKGTTIG